MSQGRPVEGETRERILALFDEGKSRNEIAREVGLSGSTVSGICADAGRTFDRSQTAIAVRARSLDLTEARQLLAQKMAVAASDMLDDLDGPYLVYNFGGKDNTYEEHLLGAAPVDVVRSAVVTAGIAFDKLTRIVERSNPELESAEGLLDMSAAMFEAAADRIRERRAEAVIDAPADEG